MRIPERLQGVDQDEAIIREYEYDDATTITMGFGPEVSNISIDIVDGMAIAVVNNKQFEFKLPEETDEIATNNGVLTIEG